MTNLLMEIGKLFNRRLFEENPFVDESVSQGCQNSVCQAVISINHCEGRKPSVEKRRTPLEEACLNKKRHLNVLFIGRWDSMEGFLSFNFPFFSGGSRNNHEGEQPRFSDSIKNISAVIGKDAILNCFVESLGMYKVGWMRHSDGSVLSVGKMVTQNTRYSVSHEETSRWTLRIHNVRDSDEGCYLCQINTCKLPHTFSFAP